MKGAPQVARAGIASRARGSARWDSAAGAIEPVIGALCVALIGAGSLVAIAGWITGNTAQAMLGAAPAALALMLLIATGWIELPVVIALAIPLPALYSSDSLRIAAAAPVTAIAVAGWLLLVTVSARRASTGRLPVRATIALVGAFALATLFARHPLVSVRELANFTLLLLLLVAATDGFARDSRAWPQAVRLLVSIAALCGVLAVLETLRVIPGEFPRDGSDLNRAALGFGQPNSLGLFFALILPFGVHTLRVARSASSRVATSVALACIIAGLLATFSRGSWLSVLGGSAILLLAGDRRFAVRVWLGALVTIVMIDVLSGGILRDTAARTVGDWTIEQRFALMAAGILMFITYPVTGVGPGGYAESLAEFGPLIPQLWDYLPTPHNAFVQMAAEAGVIGLLAFLVFLFVAVRGQVRQARAGAPMAGAGAGLAMRSSLDQATLWSLAVLCATGMVAWPFSHGAGQAVMLILAGAFAANAGRMSPTAASPHDSASDTEAQLRAVSPQASHSRAEAPEGT
ncbi:MAG: O-antigen ligase family protein [Gemmatimonadetes bacterium]|nr:O-antigen ligase family protein [Gemmatimonadota bacterium]